MIAGRSAARRGVIAAMLAVSTLGAALLSGTAAAAAAPEILVSDDGVNFTPTLTTGLFDGLGLLVPQDTVTASLWVQNTSTINGSLRLDIDDFDNTANEFTQSVTFTAVSGGTSVTSTADQLATCPAVLPTLPIAAGATVRVDITVTVGDLVGQHGQAQSAPLSFTVKVRDAVSPFPSDPCKGPTDSGNGDGALSGTGVTYLPMVAASVGLIAIGMFIVLARRRRRDKEQE